MTKQKQTDPLRAAREATAARRAAMPRCTRVVTFRKQSKVCGARLDQNVVEREDGTYWCPRCARYTDGSSGFPVGHPARREGPQPFGGSKE